MVEKTDTAPHLEDFSLVHVILQHDREQCKNIVIKNMYSHLCLWWDVTTEEEHEGSDVS